VSETVGRSGVDRRRKLSEKVGLPGNHLDILKSFLASQIALLLIMAQTSSIELTDAETKKTSSLQPCHSRSESTMILTASCGTRSYRV